MHPRIVCSLALTVSLCAWSATAQAAPVADEPAPAAGELAPATDEPAPPKLPGDGGGLITIGAFMFPASAGLITGASLGFARSELDENNTQIYAGLYVLGGLTLAGASVLTYFGAKRRASYRTWVAKQGDEVPRQGNAMRASGAVLIGAGGAATLGGVFALATSSFAYSPDGSSDFPYYMLGFGLGAVATGVPLLVVGNRRNKRFHRWSRERAPSAQLRPFLAPMGRRGASIGLAGSF